MEHFETSGGGGGLGSGGEEGLEVGRGGGLGIAVQDTLGMGDGCWAGSGGNVGLGPCGGDMGLWVGGGGKCFGLRDEGDGRAGDTVFQLQGGSMEMFTSGPSDVEGGGAEQLGSRGAGEAGFLRTGEAVVGAEESMVHNSGKRHSVGL